MGSNLSVSKEIEEYINNHSIKLNPIQKEIISYNESLGDIKRMQISISQCHFLHLLVKTSKIKKNFRNWNFYWFKYTDNVISITR